MNNSLRITAGRLALTERLKEAGKLSPGRLPMLIPIFERFAESLSERISKRTSLPIEAAFESFASGDADTPLLADGAVAVCSKLHARQWNADVGAAIDMPSVLVLLERLLGQAEHAAEIAAARPVTAIELAFSQIVFSDASLALSDAFLAVTHSEFRASKAEARDVMTTSGDRPGPVVRATFRLTICEEAGIFLITIPHSAILPMQQKLSRGTVKPRAARDPNWSDRIQSEVKQATVTLCAVLEEHSLTFGDIANLAPGGILALKSTASSPVDLRCGDVTIYTSSLGQFNGAYTVRIESGALAQPSPSTVTAD